MERSLRNLNTETLDVLQFHGGWYPAEDVEKILERGEDLPQGWAIAGTSGYDFLSAVNGVWL